MVGWQAFVTQWGSSAAERAEGFRCDQLVQEPDLELYRAVDIVAVDPESSRLLVKLLVARPRGTILAPGDLVMMRRQLLNLKRLAEQTPRPV